MQSVHLGKHTRKITTELTECQRACGIKQWHTRANQCYSRGTATPYSCGFSDTTFCLSSLNLAPKQPNKIEVTDRFLCGMKDCKENKIDFTRIVWCSSVLEETCAWETSWAATFCIEEYQEQTEPLNKCWTSTCQAPNQEICNLSSQFKEIPLISSVSMHMFGWEPIENGSQKWASLF